jgi:hypothetical protein
MSRGLADTPEPEQSGLTLKELDEAFKDLAGFVGMLSVRLETLEDLIAAAIKLQLPEEEKRITGL